MPKLTLSVDPATVVLAKTLAAENGTSVSAVFERFVGLLAVQRNSPAKSVAPLTQSLSGIVSIPKATTTRDVLEDALLDRNKLGK